jgi:hypothetical protein
MAKPSGGSVEPSGWYTTSVSLQIIGGRLAAPLDSSSTLGGGWGNVSECLSVSITADASVVPPPRRLTLLRKALGTPYKRPEKAPDMGDLAVAVALSYVDFRLSEIRWREAAPKLAAWLDGITARPSMAATAPE